MTASAYRPLLLILILSIAALAVALFSQHVAGMRPCAWCVFQRLIVILIGGIALIGMLLEHISRMIARLALLIITALGLGGVLAAWYQYSVAAAQFSCDQTFADQFMTGLGLDAAWPSLFGIYASCMDARADLLGVEYALWSLTLFALLSVISLLGLVRTYRRHS